MPVVRRVQPEQPVSEAHGSILKHAYWPGRHRSQGASYQARGLEITHADRQDRSIVVNDIVQTSHNGQFPGYLQLHSQDEVGHNVGRVEIIGKSWPGYVGDWARLRSYKSCM